MSRRLTHRNPPVVTTSSHSHSHAHHHDQHPHADLDALESGPDAVLHAGAFRTEKIAKFLEAHFGEVEVVETREIEVGEATNEEDTVMQDGDEVHTTEKEQGHEKLLVFEPAIVVKLDDWEARVGLLDLVRVQFLMRCIHSIFWKLTVCCSQGCPLRL